MTKELSAETLAMEMSEIAEKIHREQGELVPTVAFFHEEAGALAQVMVSSEASHDVPSALFMIGMTIGAVVEPKPTWIVLNVEGWSKRADGIESLDEADQRMPKGHLEKLHREGDTSVHTVLITHVSGTEGGLYSVMVDADQDYERRTEPHMEGRIPESFEAINEHLDEARKLVPPDYGIRDALSFISPFISAAIIPDDGGPGDRVST